MGDVNVELYELLRERECHLYHNSKGYYPVAAYVCLYHYDIDDFCKILGRNCFDEEGIECSLRFNYIVVELNDIIIEYFEHKLSSYANCFVERDEYIGEILQMEDDL